MNVRSAPTWGRRPPARFTMCLPDHSPYAGTDWLWDVDKTMTRLIQEGEIRPAIVVSVWMNDEKKVSRRAEYMPQKILIDEVRQWMPSEQPDLDGEEFTSDS